MDQPTANTQRGTPPLLPPARGRGARRLIIGLLLVVGVQLWLVAGRGYLRGWEPRALGVILLMSCVPPVARGVSRVHRRLRRPGRMVTAIVAVAIAICGAVYVVHDARGEGRPLAPRYQDEFSYLIQARQLAHGRLWMPAHPLADFFESFQLLSTPVYGSIYFPGAAMMFVPGVWLGLPPWVMPVVCAGVAVALLFVVVTRMLGAGAGLLAAGMLVATPDFRLVAVKPMAQVPALLLGLLAVEAYLLWRRGRRVRYAVLMGAALGWAAITRPPDAVCVGVPLVIAVALDLKRASRRDVARLVLAVCLSAAPFAVVQGVFNYGVTGRLLESPFTFYAERDLPNTRYGFHAFDPAARPASGLAQKLDYYESTAAPAARAHTVGRAARTWMWERVPYLLRNGLPHPLLLALVPVGIVGLGRGRRWVLAGVVPTFMVVYFFYGFFFPHYVVPVIPGFVVCALCGVAVVTREAGRWRHAAVTFLSGAAAVLAVGQLQEFNRTVIVEPMRATEIREADEALVRVRGPAIVLFRYGPGCSSHQEPVYNFTVAWPDDAPVIRAHDLGPGRDVELFRYYASRQPAREVYRYDRASRTLTDLGNVARLASGTGGGG